MASHGMVTAATLTANAVRDPSFQDATLVNPEQLVHSASQ